MPISERRGASLLVLSVCLIILAISLSVVVPRADLEVRRGKEEMLRFRLGEFKRAVAKFARCHNRQPVNKEELLVDELGNRFLRQAYEDPMTGSFDWSGAQDENGIFFVHSASEEASISGARYCDFR